MNCPNCGHDDHNGDRCDGMADGDFCACSWPDPSNYTAPPATGSEPTGRTIQGVYEYAFNRRRANGESWGWGEFLKATGLDPAMPLYQLQQYVRIGREVDDAGMASLTGDEFNAWAKHHFGHDVPELTDDDLEALRAAALRQRDVMAAVGDMPIDNLRARLALTDDDMDALRRILDLLLGGDT